MLPFGSLLGPAWGVHGAMLEPSLDLFGPRAILGPTRVQQDAQDMSCSYSHFEPTHPKKLVVQCVRLPVKGLLGSSGGYSGPPWGFLGPSWAILGPSWGHFGAISGPTWAQWGTLVPNLGTTSAQPGAILGQLGAIFAQAGHSWGHGWSAVAIVGPCWSFGGFWRSRPPRSPHVRVRIRATRGRRGKGCGAVVSPPNSACARAISGVAVHVFWSFFPTSSACARGHPRHTDVALH